MALWNDLLGNLAVVAICTSIWTFCHRWLVAQQPIWSSVMLGSIMTLGTGVVMMMPFQLQPGIFLDLRYTFIAVACFFGGPLVGAAPVIAALIIRSFIGGTGLPVGLSHIMLAMTCALLIRSLTRRHGYRRWTLPLLAAAVGLSGTMGFAFVIPSERWLPVLQTTVTPFASVLMASTLIACLAILQEQRRQKVTEDNVIYRAIIQALPDCLNAKDLDGRFVAANPATAVLMQAETIDGLLGRTDFDFFPAETAREFRNVELSLMADGRPFTIEQRFTKPDGTETWLSTLKAPLLSETGQVVGVISHNREITAQKHVEAELERVEQRLAAAVSTMAHGLAMFDAGGRLVFRNARYLELFPTTAHGSDPGPSLRATVRDATPPGEDAAGAGGRETTSEQTFASLPTGGTRQMQLADDRWIEARSSPTAEGGAMVVFTDITDVKEAEADLKAMNLRLADLATTDALTGLANRRAFDEALIEKTLQACRTGHDLALMMIDVDRFKAYNDTYGHRAGDAALQQVAHIVREIGSAHDHALVARYGGEEIAVIIPRLDAAAALTVAESMCAAVRTAALVHGESEHGIVTVSIGIALLSRRQGRRTTDLVDNADKALYQAKADGRNQARHAVPSPNTALAKQAG